MKATKISNNGFSSQFIIFGERKQPIAIVKVTNESKECFEVEMLEKTPMDLFDVYDFIRANWR